MEKPNDFLIYPMSYIEDLMPKQYDTFLSKFHGVKGAELFLQSKPTPDSESICVQKTLKSN